MTVVALLPGTLATWLSYRRWAYQGDAWSPPCSCGGELTDRAVGAEYHLCCHSCGTRYVQRRGTVWLYDPGGYRVFRRLKIFRGWV